jgi:hypothetical protein
MLDVRKARRVAASVKERVKIACTVGVVDRLEHGVPRAGLSSQALSFRLLTSPR